MKFVEKRRGPVSSGTTQNKPRCRIVDPLKTRYIEYGAAAIVFDGYNDDPTTKDATHLRRTGDYEGVTVHFASGMMIKSKKDEFRNNKANKQRFIHYFSQ